MQKHEKNIKKINFSKKKRIFFTLGVAFSKLVCYTMYVDYKKSNHFAL